MRVPADAHPRLYCTADDLPRLRALRSEGVHRRIWENIRRSAEQCLELRPRAAWIPPVQPDPIHENLYDRFYAIMGDLAITEHLALAYAYSGEARYGEAARRWVLASCRAWQQEAEGRPDGGKAYAVCRLLKGLAVGYDCVAGLWSASERAEIRDTLTRIGQAYYDGYFTTPAIAGPDFHTHHATVEWASFGVAALALLGEHAPAEQWLAATVSKFERDLLPRGLAPDGAQVEGATFWASTMQYRLFFMDALRRVTGHDLFKPFAAPMSADLALAGVAAEKEAGHDEDHQTVILEPSYGQLNYYAPVLLALAREYRRPLLQHLALWDHTLGGLQDTRYVTPHGEQLRFCLGAYAFAWYDSSLPAAAEEKRHAFHFPSVEEAYLRASWQPCDLIAGVRRGTVVAHAGGRPVLVDLTAWDPARVPAIRQVTDDGARAVVRCGHDEAEEALVVALDLPGHLRIRRRVEGEWTWWCQSGVTFQEDTWSWAATPQPATMRLVEGTVRQWEPDGYQPEMAVGYSLLKLHDPAPRRYPRATVAPDPSGYVTLEISTG